MILDFLQVNPDRTAVLDKAGGFGVLPADDGSSFLELMSTYDSPGRENPPYVAANSTRQYDEIADEDRRSSEPERVDIQAVADLLAQRKASGPGESPKKADAAAGLQEGMRSAEKKTRQELNTGEAPDDESGEGIQQVIAAMADTSRRSGDKPAEKSAAETPEKPVLKLNSVIGNLSGEEGKKSGASKADGTDISKLAKDMKNSIAQRDSSESEPAETESAETNIAHALSVSAQGSEEETVDLQQLRALKAQESAEGREVPVRDLAAEIQNREEPSRRTLIQIVDLRQDDRPTRLEQLRADLRTEVSGEGRTVNRGVQFQNSGFSGSGNEHGGQPGDGQGNQFSAALMDRFFRGQGFSSADGSSSDSSFAQMIQRMGAQASAPQQMSADAARFLGAKMQEHLNSDIVRQARFVLRDGDAGEIRLRLRPESLGNVQIKLDVQDSVIAARILVENSSVRQVFEQQAAELAKAFEDAGLQLGSMDVSVGNENSPGESGDSREASRLRSVRTDQQQTEMLGDSVRDITMLGTGDRLVNIMA
ncbi:MAG: flagellar hook-length control protein FliK [Spirochaeta sp.]